MKFKLHLLFLLFVASLVVSCSTDNAMVTNQTTAKTIKYLALGDSYTIGQSVCETCRFPIQLQDSIKKKLQSNAAFTTTIIATTGWTTSDLKLAIATQNSSNDYDLVTLLIGVNNQYQSKPFSLYQQEFPELVATAIQKAKGKKENVIVVSIPDYAYTPYGQGAANISTGVAQYNNFAQYYCASNGITFINITDITQQGLINPSLVASDGLHPSTLAYSKFVERILPEATIIIQP
ncbi:GDSL-type esterase/lipase family protein [Flavobacterium sp. SUN052]|jgi:acyl-CoA thioesterase I|uniref:GDSL-type esterase/lipase family protein n=1 Tax=Flavobacterium sp. SUN052 TaxID=3002441 RepID=UPI00237DA926|nr:GDSL-type esterase/lipase family protein [Flavobacterium sp. SUN052]MEC4004030.1 GDSL-type esterase/lipase family protein [Flavobacterium sp. SUN052]